MTLPERFCLKVFVDGAPPAQSAFIPVFHRWIQEQKLGTQLIDVADYTHVRGGPGVMLVAHEAHYRMDEAGGRLGLLYARRRSLSGTLPERLQRIFASTLEACVALEKESALGGLRFRTDELELSIDDRLLAPNDAATLATLRPALEPLLAELYAGAPVAVEPSTPLKAPFGVRLAVRSSADVATLAARLSQPREAR